MPKCEQCGKLGYKYDDLNKRYFCTYKCMAIWLSNEFQTEFKEEILMGLDVLKDWKPEKNVDEFAPIKGNRVCTVDEAKIVDYSGQFEDWKGQRQIKLQIRVAPEQPSANRVFFKQATFNNEKNMKKIATDLFTVGLDVGTTEETLQAALEKFADMTIKVNFWSWKPEGADDHIQFWKVMEEATANADTPKAEVPF